MSAASDPADIDTSGWDEQWLNARDAFEAATPGDRVLFGDRKEPLVVEDAYEEDGRTVLVLEGPSGGIVRVREQYNPNGTPDYRSQRGADATNLRIVERQTPAGDDDDGGDDDVTPDDIDGVPNDRMQNWPPKTPEGSDELDGDTFASSSSGDPFLEFDNFYESHFEDAPSGSSIFGGATDLSTWTFIDELNAVGADMPKTVNNWTLIDYGVVKNGITRKAVWANAETDEAVAVGLVRDPDDDDPVWYVWYAEDYQNADSEIDPEVSTTDPSEALDRVREYLYGDTDTIDIEVVEDENGNISIRENIDDATLGERVLDLYGKVPELPVSISYPGGAASWVGDSWSRFLTYLDDNKAKAGRVAKFALVYSVVNVAQKFFGVTFSPVVEPDALGINVQYRYTGKLSGFLDIIPENETADPQTETVLEGSFTVDPRDFNLHEADPKTPLGIDYDTLVMAGQVVGIDKAEFKAPLSDKIMGLRVGEDEDGDTVIVDRSSGGRSKSVKNKYTRGGSSRRAPSKSVRTSSNSQSADSGTAVLDGNSVHDDHIDKLEERLREQSEYANELAVLHTNCIVYIHAWMLKKADEKGEDVEDYITAKRVESKTNDYKNDVGPGIVDPNTHGDIDRDSLNEDVLVEAVKFYEERGSSTPYSAFTKANKKLRNEGSGGFDIDKFTKDRGDSNSGSQGDDSPGVQIPENIAEQAAQEAGEAVESSDVGDSGNGDDDSSGSRPDIGVDPDYLGQNDTTAEGIITDDDGTLLTLADMNEHEISGAMQSLRQRQKREWTAKEKQWVNRLAPEQQEQLTNDDDETTVSDGGTYSEDEMRSGSPMADAWGADVSEEQFFGSSGVPFDERDDRL